MTKYADDMPAAKKDKVALTGDDCREGLTCVLSSTPPLALDCNRQFRKGRTRTRRLGGRRDRRVLEGM